MATSLDGSACRCRCLYMGMNVVDEHLDQKLVSAVIKSKLVSFSLLPVSHLIASPVQEIEANTVTMRRKVIFTISRLTKSLSSNSFPTSSWPISPTAE